LREVLNIAKEYEMLVIADEVYGDLVFSGNEFVSMRSLVSDAQVESLYIVGSPSKSHGMSGFRLGYIVANKTFVKQCISVNSQTISNVPVYAQKIWVDVVRHKTFQSDYKAELEQRYNEAYAALKKANLFELAQEKATIYLFPKLPVMRLSDSEYCLHMLKTKGIAMLPGSAFGMPGYVRISVGNSTLSEIQEGMKLLVEETKKLITQ
ncbi:MAG: aminotransferase class I/II-fold pyridoxal phosphate-dependent enzyme, partial [Patescibacteria group bacterium]